MALRDTGGGAFENGSMNPISLPPEVVTGIITGAIALIGIIYTQHQAGKRESSRIDEERKSQRELWERDHRRTAHLAFLAEQRRLTHWMEMYTRVGLEGVDEPKENWAESLRERLLDVQVFGSQEVAVAGQHLYELTLDLKDGTVGPMMEADQAAEKFRRLVQSDLGLDQTSFPRWDSEEDPGSEASATP